MKPFQNISSHCFVTADTTCLGPSSKIYGIGVGKEKSHNKNINVVLVGPLPREISNNPVIMADIVNFATDYHTLPTIDEPGVNQEYINMVRTLGIELYINQRTIKAKGYSLSYHKEYIENSKMYLDRPGDQRITVLQGKSKQDIEAVINNYLESKHQKRGGTTIKNND